MKQALRTKYRAIRDELPEGFRENANAIICKKLNELISSSPCIASYVALNSEARVTLPMPHALPATVGNVLEFYMWDGKSELIPGKYCKEPIPSAPVIPDVIIVPCLSFARDGHRLGYGKGFYDRTLALSKYQNTLKIGVAFAAGECEELPHEAHDVPLDMVITELEVIRAKN